MVISNAELPTNKQYAVVATAGAAAGGQATVQLWSVRDGRHVSKSLELPVTEDIHACDVSADGRWFACSQGSSAVVRASGE